jgi:hypothetical protein
MYNGRRLMFFLNHRYFVEQKTFLSFEEIAGRYGLDYFAEEVKALVYFSHRWLDLRVADEGSCFIECKTQVDQIISGFADQPQDLHYFGFFFDYSCIPQCDTTLFPANSQVLEKLKRLMLIELYQTVTQATTLYLCHANSEGYHARMWIVMELLIGFDKGIEQIPTKFRGDSHLKRLWSSIGTVSEHTDLLYFVRKLTRDLECRTTNDRTAVQLTLYRYLQTRNMSVPIELLNLAMWDVHQALRAALGGDLARLEKHVDAGLASWRSTIEDLGFNQEFREMLMQLLPDGTYNIRWDALPMASTKLDCHLNCSAFVQTAGSIRVDYGPLVAVGALDESRVQRCLSLITDVEPDAATVTAIILNEAFTTMNLDTQDVRLCCLPLESGDVYDPWTRGIERTWGAMFRLFPDILHYDSDGEFVACYGKREFLYTFVVKNCEDIDPPEENLMRFHKDRVSETIRGMVGGERRVLVIIIDEREDELALASFLAFASRVVEQGNRLRPVLQQAGIRHGKIPFDR